MNPPRWAEELVIRACEYMGKDDLPELQWRHRSQQSSCGSCFLTTGEIRITAGSARQDARHVLLHEMAHYISGQKHTAGFWELAWKLYRWAKLPIRQCQKREYAYMKGAAVAYRRTRRVK